MVSKSIESEEMCENQRESTTQSANRHSHLLGLAVSASATWTTAASKHCYALRWQADNVLNDLESRDLSQVVSICSYLKALGSLRKNTHTKAFIK